VTRVADTSVLYALFSEDDAWHARAKEAFAEVDPVRVPSEILVETIDLLAYRFGHASGARALEALLALPHVTVAEQVEAAAVQAIHAAGRGTLSLADAYVVQTCLMLGAEVLSYDEDIRDELFRRRP